jgi:hypothetical protein
VRSGVAHRATATEEGIDASSERGDVTVMKLLSRIWAAFSLRGVAAHLRKLIVAVIGGTILLIGVALIVLPGPAFIVIPLGLAILATEFAWARRMVVRARAMFAKARGRKPETAAR